LEEKRKLISDKYELFANNPDMITTFRTSNQIAGPQLKKAFSETENLNSEVLIEAPSLKQLVSMGKMEE
jgi:hemoglobin-like flavoprotein